MIAIASVFNNTPDVSVAREIDIRVDNEVLQWQYKGDDSWFNLFDLTSLEGEPGSPGEAGLPGQPGSTGAQGPAGKEVTFRVTDDAIEWQYVGDSAWQSLIALNLLRVSQETSSVPSIGANGNWFINGVDSGVSAQGPTGVRGSRGFDGAAGPVGAQGPQGLQGTPGAIGVTGVGITNVEFIKISNSAVTIIDCDELFDGEQCLDSLSYFLLDNSIIMDFNDTFLANPFKFKINVVPLNEGFLNDDLISTFDIFSIEIDFSNLEASSDYIDYVEGVYVDYLFEFNVGDDTDVSVWIFAYKDINDQWAYTLDIDDYEFEDLALIIYQLESDGYENLVITMTDDSEIVINYTELVQNGATYESFLSQLADIVSDIIDLEVRVATFEAILEALDLRFVYTALSEAERLANLVALNSIYGFDHLFWNSVFNADNLEGADLNPVILSLIHSVDDYTLYHRDNNFNHYDRFNWLDPLVANFVLAHYLESNTTLSALAAKLLDDILGVSYEEDYSDLTSYSEEEFDFFVGIISLLIGVNFSDNTDLRTLDSTLTGLGSRHQSSFFQYMMTNPLTGWSLNSLNDLREFISMSARGLLTNNIILNLDPEGFGIQLLDSSANGNNRSKLTGGSSFFTTDWRAGGKYGISTNQSNLGVNTYDFNGDYNLNFPYSSSRSLNLYFGTTDIRPGTYPVSSSAITNYSFQVNYGQVFPLPTEVNFRGYLLGANIITEVGIRAQDTYDNRLVMTSVTDSGIHKLDYVVYGDNLRTFRLNNFYIESVAPSNIPNCVISGTGSTNTNSDRVIGISHGDQNYFNLSCLRELGATTVTSIFTNIVGDSTDFGNKNLTNQNRSTSPFAFVHHTFTWPEERQYITFNQSYGAGLYSDGSTTDIQINAHWVEVFKVEFVVEGVVVRTEFVDKAANLVRDRNGFAIGMSVTDSSILNMLDAAGKEFVPGTEAWVISGTSTAWTPETVITANTVIVAETIRPIVYEINYEHLELPFVGLVTQPALVTFTALDLQPNNLTLLTPSAVDGFDFQGWVTDSAITNVAVTTTGINFVTEISQVGNVTLYAVFTPTVYTITVVNDGTNPTIPSSYTIFDTINLPNGSLTGHEFDGWTGTNVSSSNTISAGSIGDITITAVYTINQYTISFNSNGGTQVNSITLDYNTSVTKPTDPTFTGYTFAGWFTDPQTLQNSYTFTTMPPSSVTLYAKWNPVNYSITIIVSNEVSGNFGFEGIRNVGEVIKITGDLTGLVIEIKDVNNNIINLIQGSDNTFTMPAANVTITISENSPQ
jgi:uncharacterized repeat protein (TIGR02543 family)